jgi:hypothetical protein
MEVESMKNELNMNKEFADYQEKIKENRVKNEDRAIKNFYDWLIKYDIDLSEVDSIVVEEKGVFLSDINVYTKIRGKKKWIYETDNREIINLLEKYNNEIERRIGVSICYSRDVVGIPFLTEKLLDTWEIDCTGIK